MASRDCVRFFLLGFLVALTLPESCSSANECSFVRSYQNEQCVYNIHLTQDSSPCSGEESTPRRGRRHFRRHLSPEKEKIDSMERSFSFMKDAHEKRLQELEGTVRGLLGVDPYLSSMMETSLDISSGDVKQGRPQDDSLLTTLHDEFAKLRKAFRKQTEQLFDMQQKLNETQGLFQQSQKDLFGANQDLLSAENRIALLERERAVLKNQIKDRSYKLDVSNARLSECDKKLTGQEEQLLGLIRSENTLSESMMTCELTLNITTGKLRTMERRHRHMKNRHARVKEVLAIREKELIHCYAAKTQTFCGFEDPDLCGFTQPNNTGDFFDWEWGEGSTPSRHTGPSADHTCRSQTGHFMFVEASAKGRGKKAIIFSPLYRGLNPQCLQFYYHMYGKHIGTLNVYAKARLGEELTSVWRAWGNQGDLWSVARLSIPKELARAGYQIAFEAITEGGYQGDMAIDDISVKDGECGEGLQAVMVEFNSTALIKEGKNFARNIRKLKLSKIPHRARKKSAGDNRN